jgi:mitochondrial fission protein ELM1
MKAMLGLKESFHRVKHHLKQPLLKSHHHDMVFLPPYHDLWKGLISRNVKTYAF